MKLNMTQLVSFLAATISVVVLTVVPAYIDGERRFRWGTDEELEHLKSRLETFPDKIGQWESARDYELSDLSKSQLQPIAAMDRTYFNPVLKRQVQVFLLLGPTGPTAAHTADICFSRRDYTQIGVRHVAELSSNGEDSTFFDSVFESKKVDRQYLRTWYAWTVDGNWKASERPRFEMADKNYLFKVQVASRYPNQEELENDEVFEQFMSDLVKQIDRHLF